MDGKGIFIWQPTVTAGGDIRRIVDLLVQGSFQRVEVKLADGWARYGDQRTQAMLRELVPALRAAGLSVWGWQYNYGTDAAREGAVAAEQAEAYDVDGWVFDVEAEWERRSDRLARGVALRREYERGTRRPAAYCGWPMYWNPKYPTYLWHPTDVPRQFMEWCVAGMPMAYWQALVTMTARPDSPAAAVYWLDNSLAQWRKLAADTGRGEDWPILPIGRAYDENKLSCRADAVAAFGQRVHEAGLPGISWWSMEHALTTRDRAVWETLSAMPQLGPSAAPPVRWSEATPEVRDAVVTEFLRRSGVLRKDGTVNPAYLPRER